MSILRALYHNTNSGGRTTKAMPHQTRHAKRFTANQPARKLSTLHLQAPVHLIRASQADRNGDSWSSGYLFVNSHKRLSV